MFSRKRVVSFIAVLMSVFVLASCGGSDVESGDLALTCSVPNIPNSDASACVPPPPISCPAPTVPNETNDACVVGFNPDLAPPVFFPAEDQAVLYYNRAAVDADNSPNDPSYEGYRLHTWSNDACDAYADPDTAWENGRIHDGIDPTYGAYWILDLKPGYAETTGACHNFIIHIGTDDAGKEMGGGDFKGPLQQPDDERFERMNFTFSGVPTIYEFPIDSLGEQPVSIDGAQAHWLDATTLLWDVDFALVDSVKLHYSADASLEVTLESGLNGTVADLTEVDLTDEQRAIAPHLAELPAFAGSWTAEDAKAVLKTQAVLGAYNDEGKLVAATRIQIPNVLDQLYTSGEADADEAVLGPVYTDAGIEARVWAPTATNVALKLYDENKRLTSTNAMSYDNATGIWSYAGSMDMDRQLYRYEVTVYHPANDQIEVLDVTDPYSVSLAMNGRFSQFVNLLDEDLKPDRWDEHTIPTIEDVEDAVLYEGHIRDFSALDTSVSAANRGKYLAFTETESAPMQHLAKLAEKGVTHFHMLPANDIATINEDESKTVDFSSTVQEVCVIKPTTPICLDNTPRDMTIGDLYDSFSVLAEPGAAQELAQMLRDIDRFNWGYDPKHFNAPEGSYASNPDGVARIIEMRAMNQALHEIGLRVVLDVVYNHTNASGLFENSVFDKVVPGYYHRYEVDTGAIVRETCCDDTEPRNRMMEKFMEDSLLLWTEHYKFDGFRFDIMSQATKQTMVDLYAKVREIDADNYFYGEGWIRQDRGYEQANQINMAGTQIGTFNDRTREGIRRANIFYNGNPNSRLGTASETSLAAAMNDQDIVKMTMAGTLTDFVLETSGGSATETSSLGGYTLDPADSINYVSKHDNETLWDQYNYNLPNNLSLEQRIRAQNIGIGIPMLSQGIPFLQVGGDFLRSKSMDRNTFDSGDWFSRIDFSMETNNWNVGLPMAQDNEGMWDTISTFMFAPERAAAMSDIEMAAEVFQEFLSIRSGSKLFRLTTAEDIKQRLGFHNIGARQQQGLIVMSLDDGITPDSAVELDDLDPMHDAIVVVVNTGYEEKSIEVLTATGFELHSVHANSIDPTVRSATFTEGADESGNGTFTVPALTMAVFVKNQGTERGYGLSAIATSGAPDIVPFGDTAVFLRGSMNDWGESTQFDYKGDGVYEVAFELTGATSYAFKVASADWSTVNLGDSADPIVVEDVAKTLVPGGENLSFTPSIDATYVFSLDASDTSAPVLTIVNEEPYVGNPIYLRGGMNGWGLDDEFNYDGGRLYSVAVNLNAEEYQFKVANEGWANPNLGAFSEDDIDDTIVLGQNTFLTENGTNLFISVAEAGDYVFIFDSTDLSEPKIRVFAEEFFGASTVYVRGSLNGWGEVDALAYQGDGVYSVNIDLDGADVAFKVATGDWSTVNLGAASDETAAVTLGEAKVLFQDGNSSNLTLTAPAAGTYEFRVEGPDATAPKVTVTAVD
ncbi:pullulanase-type alpha-1,6-glucosidase [Glaciecola sp. MH2013]|uniref:pullulanase-type alpha-1,6-glucosidase n=1 Tax=Glaciecola sp. MH2013 TaxID=2785524 RepID=UPI00189CE774|nr:pullulanase-type alpha-1,6-glucosidase [Glaciecola sp. MH2013]MBF7072684.1 pullulanase-type alpha-1,6-glucosidase [Glaciecola sp. MH2013]